MGCSSPEVLLTCGVPCTNSHRRVLRASNRWAAWPQPHFLLTWEARTEPSMAGCDVQAPERRIQSQSGDACPTQVWGMLGAVCTCSVLVAKGVASALWDSGGGRLGTTPPQSLSTHPVWALPCSQLVSRPYPAPSWWCNAGVSRGREGGVELDLAAGLAEEGGVSECGTLSRAEDSGRPRLPRWEGDQAASVARDM